MFKSSCARQSKAGAQHGWRKWVATCHAHTSLGQIAVTSLRAAARLQWQPQAALQSTASGPAFSAQPSVQCAGSHQTGYVRLAHCARQLPAHSGANETYSCTLAHNLPRPRNCAECGQGQHTEHHKHHVTVAVSLSLKTHPS